MEPISRLGNKSKACKLRFTKIYRISYFIINCINYFFFANFNNLMLKKPSGLRNKSKKKTNEYQLSKLWFFSVISKPWVVFLILKNIIHMFVIFMECECDLKLGNVFVFAFQASFKIRSNLITNKNRDFKRLDDKVFHLL